MIDRKTFKYRKRSRIRCARVWLTAWTMLVAFALVAWLSTGAISQAEAPNNSPGNAADGSSQKEERDELKNRVKQLIKQLGARRYRKRENAQKQLVKIGLPAEPLLVKHLDSVNPEVQANIQRILQKMHKVHPERYYGRGSRIVLLQDEFTVGEMIDKLSRRGYPVRAEQEEIRKRTVGVERHVYSFWSLVELMSLKAEVFFRYQPGSRDEFGTLVFRDGLLNSLSYAYSGSTWAIVHRIRAKRGKDLLPRIRKRSGERRYRDLHRLRNLDLTRDGMYIYFSLFIDPKQASAFHSGKSLRVKRAVTDGGMEFLRSDSEGVFSRFTSSRRHRFQERRKRFRFGALTFLPFPGKDSKSIRQLVLRLRQAYLFSRSTYELPGKKLQDGTSHTLHTKLADITFIPDPSDDDAKLSIKLELKLSGDETHPFGSLPGEWHDQLKFYKEDQQGNRRELDSNSWSASGSGSNSAEVKYSQATYDFETPGPIGKDHVLIVKVPDGISLPMHTLTFEDVPIPDFR